jgi:hypothetical protein
VWPMILGAPKPSAAWSSSGSRRNEAQQPRRPMDARRGRIIAQARARERLTFRYCGAVGTFAIFRQGARASAGHTTRFPSQAMRRLVELGLKVKTQMIKPKGPAEQHVADEADRRALNPRRDRRYLIAKPSQSFRRTTNASKPTGWRVRLG